MPSQYQHPHRNKSRGYRVTGSAAHGRVARLFRSLLDENASANDDKKSTSDNYQWVDVSPYANAAATSNDTINNNDTNHNNNEIEISFLWENAPRYETKHLRDTVQVYSHLPNGIHILDDKWALARLLPKTCSNETKDKALTTLESHCFRGSEGFETFANRVGLLSSSSVDECNTNDVNSDVSHQFEDLIQASNQQQLHLPPPTPRNLWVIKDAMSNGAGGIWIVDPSNAHDFLDTNTTTKNNINQQQQTQSILHPQHRYIAQQYAWPPTLYNRRKCHVRVYGLITSDGRAYVHQRAFLHVANDIFEYDSSCLSVGDEAHKEDGEEGKVKQERFEAAVHITNCCANSHDEDKFSGEICVRLDQPGPFSNSTANSHTNSGSDDDLSLGDYFPSIAASIAKLAEASAPYVQGGQANQGFEYLGLDFVLSSVPQQGDDEQRKRRPVAYLLEVNAPPSQDTATGLPHAEELHDEVISDLLRLWVLPNLGVGLSGGENGWMCVYSPPPPFEEEDEKVENLIAPSKAAILNKIRWAMFEKRSSREYELSWKKEQDGGNPNNSIVATLDSDNAQDNKCESGKTSYMHDPDSFASFARSQFPYFSDSMITTTSSSSSPAEATMRENNIFLESGGGAQVPRVVIDAMSASLMNRDRSVVGAKYLSEARESIASLLATRDEHDERTVVMGANATCLIANLVQMYCASGMLGKDDEIVIASENHLANVTPWIEAAESVGAKVKWWTVTTCQEHLNDNKALKSSSNILSDLINERTRIVAVSHASNILGRVRDISSICNLVEEVMGSQGHVIVDGVAAAPHLLSCGDDGCRPHWYVVSLHKMFGPHLGCMIGRKSAAMQISNVDGDSSSEKLCKKFEMGTMNYEACAGAVALKRYFEDLGNEAWRRNGNPDELLPTRQEQTTLSTQSSGDQVVEEQSCPLSNSARLSLVRTCIHQVESRLLDSLLGYLRKIPRVRIIEDNGEMKVSQEDKLIPSTSIDRRIPIVAFVHETIPSSEIVTHCRNHGVTCRACKFLSTDLLWNEMDLNNYDGVVRFSLAHYNTISDIERTIAVLELLNDWQE